MVGDAGAVQRCEKPVTASVSGEHPACAVCSVSGGGQAYDEASRIGIAEVGNRPPPVVVVAERLSLFECNAFSRAIQRAAGTKRQATISALRSMRLSIHSYRRTLGLCPSHEYEPLNHDCLMCEGRVDVIQGIQEAPLQYCPWCGLDVEKRVVSRASIKLSETVETDKAGKRGFTTFKRAERGVWEKVSGVGPDMVSGSKEDIAAVEAEKRASTKKVI